MALFLAQRASHPALGDCLGVDLEMPFQLLGGLLGWCCRREEVENSPGLFPPSARRATQLCTHFIVRAGHRTSSLHRAKNSIVCTPRKKGCGLRSSEHMVLPVWGLCGSTRQSEHQGCAGCCRDGLAMCALSLALSRAAHSDCCSRQARPTMNAFGLLTLHVN